MNDKTVEFLTRFIEIYHNHPALWKVRSKVYQDKKLKQAGYLHLLQHYKTADENATLETVKKRINNLRCSFRKELKKARASVDRAYVPNLWYYNMLLFVADQEDPRKIIRQSEPCNESSYSENENSEIEMVNFIEKTEPNDDSHSLLEKTEPIDDSHSLLGTPITYSEMQDHPTELNYCETNNVSYKRKLEHDTRVTHMSDFKDEFDVIGANVAFKLRRMDSQQMLLAEHLINSVLFNGLQNNLTTSSQFKI